VSVIRKRITLNEGSIEMTEGGANRDWRNLPGVLCRLVKDEVGYPPKEWEELKAEPTNRLDICTIKSVPFYAKGLGYEDEVRVGYSPEGYYPVVEEVVKRSGYSTVRLWIEGKEEPSKAVEYFKANGTLVEFLGRLVALAVPLDVLSETLEYIDREKQKGRWDSERGYYADEEGGAD
jgi:hypothetical protein